LKHQETKEVYIYSSQPNNYYENQLNELREKVRNDPHNFYTYSEKYLTLSIDPWTLEQQNKIEKSLSLSVYFIKFDKNIANFLNRK